MRRGRASRALLAGIIALTVAIGGSPLSGQAAAAPEVLYRVNAGGQSLSVTPSWSADTISAPSSFVNALATGNTTFDTTTPIDLSDPSVPAGTPEAVFQSERWDGGATPELQWDFPVTSGPYEVRLYFSEIYPGTQRIGAREFDVSIEGTQVLNDFDVYAAVGGYKGLVKTFKVTSDANLDIDFGHAFENPAIKGIEVIKLGPNQLASLSVRPKTFRAKRSGSSISPTTGTWVAYRIFEKAPVRFTVERVLSGRKVGGRCAPPRRSNRKRSRCIRYLPLGSFTHQGNAGQNRFHFTGRVANKKLRGGRYRLVAVSLAGATANSKPERASFRIVR